MRRVGGSLNRGEGGVGGVREVHGPGGSGRGRNGSVNRGEGCVGVLGVRGPGAGVQAAWEGVREPRRGVRRPGGLLAG